ncbi:glycosyltransferase family 2 protein [Thermophagus xiamenensis]|uniref:Glycosyltransferase involved in cell wall bisynthesis n=1 Tax=Thermophagus xiamenensis TaxID=385682 RepID=A0A1I2CT76_9BACT|nr:glycosyltransferase family 2 protein [Thermophagus xiamenensis]SFE71547.1 Glycosyltransferase involved in cell wall bisynthesis [Thermophagus xiamenensis]
MAIKATVIFTTYNQPEWLRKVLWGYECQTEKNFEIVIADDGSGEETQKVIDHFKSNSLLNIQHVWHPDDGYQKCTILNKAIIASQSEYLIFTDGDCIPRKDFVEVHLKYAESGYFLSGGTLRLPLSLSKKITRQDVIEERVFNLKWLYTHGLPRTFKSTKLFNISWYSSLLNRFTPTKASWNGHNSSGWKADIVAINGFNETMLYGGQDRELGERLINYGIKSKQIRYSAVCVHLEHGRPYKTKESIQRNKAIRAEVRRKNRFWMDDGISRHLK